MRLRPPPNTFVPLHEELLATEITPSKRKGNEVEVDPILSGIHLYKPTYCLHEY